MSNKDKTWNEACRKTCNDLADVLISKQNDYGKDNILDFGENGILVRTNDKFARLKNLYKEDKNPNNESIDDTWLDIAGYSIVATMVRDGSFNLPLVGKAKKKRRFDTSDAIVVFELCLFIGIVAVFLWLYLSK